MGRASPLKQILRTQRREGLDAIRRELAPRVSSDGSREDYIERLRRSLQNSIDKGKVDYGDLLDVIQADNAKYVSTRIKRRMKDTIFSKTSNHWNNGRLSEQVLTAELYQALRYKFKKDDIQVFDERSIGGNNRPDLLIEDHRNRNHLIEIKTPDSLNTLLNQLNSYTNSISYHSVYVCYVTETKSKMRENNNKINGTLASATRHYDATIVEKGPDHFRTK